MRTDVPTVVPQFLRSRIGKICVAIIGSTPAEMLEKATAVVKENPFLEFRLDYLDKPILAMPKLKQFLADNTAVTAIATCRRAANNGKFAGNIAAEVEVLTKAAEAGFQIADLELESAEHLKKAELQAFRDTGVALIVSYHDFNGTKDLEATYNRIQPFKPDFIKIVSTAKSLYDNVTMMRFLERMDDHTNIIAICMGDDVGVVVHALEEAHHRDVVVERLRRGDDLDEVRLEGLDAIVSSLEILGPVEVVVADDEGDPGVAKCLQFGLLQMFGGLEFEIRDLEAGFRCL